VLNALRHRRWNQFDITDVKDFKKNVLNALRHRRWNQGKRARGYSRKS